MSAEQKLKFNEKNDNDDSGLEVEEYTSPEERLRELTKIYKGVPRPIKGFNIKCETLPDLIKTLHQAFSTDYVNIEFVHQLIFSYKSNPEEWRRFAKFDRYRYTRNLVDSGNGKFNLLILCWGQKHGSAIHDHADSHCFMKMLQGNLTEIRYAWPKVKNSHNEEYNRHELEEIGRSTLDMNGVCYINDSLGLHRVENPSSTEGSVSLHLYCPPFEECSVFDENTGERSKSQVTFWSVNGEKLSRMEKSR